MNKERIEEIRRLLEAANKPDIGNPLNNNLTNLEYVTPSENVLHAAINGRLNYKTSFEDLHEIRRLYVTGLSQEKIAKKFKITQGTVGRIIRGLRAKYLELEPIQTRSTAGIGEKNGRAVLTEDDVRFIRQSDIPATQLAPLYGVNRESIRRARKGESWKHVE